MSIRLSEYFQRIGFTQEARPDLETLKRLHYLHTVSIPFENLSPLAGAPVSLAPEDLFSKLVSSRRGGYCFEQNLLFLTVLRQLGFVARGLGARVIWNQAEDAITRRSHMLIEVSLPEGTYLADVGFGGLTLTQPLRFELEATQPTTHENFRIIAYEGDHKLQAEVSGSWKSLYRFDLQEQYQADYEVMNYFLSTHPTSIFTTSLIAARPTTEGRLALSNTLFSVYRNNGETIKRNLTSVEEIKEVLTAHFHVEVPAGLELEKLLQPRN